MGKNKALAVELLLCTSIKEHIKKIRKAKMSISDKGIQKCTTLQRNGVQMRDRPQRMTSNPKKKIVNLSELSGSNPRIRTPLDR